MSERNVMEQMPEPLYLPQEKKKCSRSLYEEVFAEDSARFVEFYYTYKTRENQILALEQDGMLVSMLHLNPYRMVVNGYETPANYIVAVATKKEYRHRGYMRLLLEKALKDMGDQGMPFTFLMPASEKIYAPFDFVWICSYTNLPPRVERMDAEEQNRYLASRYQVFCKRDRIYMENLAAERKAEEGEAVPEKMPPFMARITDVCQMLQMAYSHKKQRLYLQVHDSIIENNDGWFCWDVSADSSRVQKLKACPEKIDLDLTVGELTSLVFEGLLICLSENV